MMIAYYSMTGNVRRFVERAGLPSVEITPGLTLSERYILVTPTHGFGEVPRAVVDFLRINAAGMVGVAASGNRNFGGGYAGAARAIAKGYGVAIVHTFELAGNAEDVRIFNERVTLIDEEITRRNRA